MSANWRIEAYHPRHEDRVAEIELGLFCKPLPSNYLKACYSNPSYGGLVIFHRKKVQAYALFRISGKAIFVDRVISEEAFAGRGMEECLLKKLIGRSTDWKTPLVIDVHDYELSSQVFLKNLGFRCTGSREVGDDVLYRMVYSHRKLPNELFFQRKSLLERKIDSDEKSTNI